MKSRRDDRPTPMTAFPSQDPYGGAPRKADRTVRSHEEEFDHGSGSVAAHEAAPNPHPDYTDAAELAAAIAAHEAAGDPHPVYLTQAEGDALYSPAGSSFTRTTVTETTGSLAHEAQETGTIALDADTASFRALKVEADRASRVRAYTTTAKRDADVARQPGTDPTGDHGVIFDVVFTGLLLSIELNPTADGYLPGTAAVLPSTIDNLSGSTSTVAIDLTYLRTE